MTERQAGAAIEGEGGCAETHAIGVTNAPVKLWRYLNENKQTIIANDHSSTV
jgi:3-methyladenine DNA glycosylase Mpg